jgi:zinc transporter ZupT
MLVPLDPELWWLVVVADGANGLWLLCIMNSLVLLTYYSLLILGASIVGGMIPVWFRLTHQVMECAVSFVAGVMLGVGLLHMLPHALEQVRTAASPPASDLPVMLWVLTGFLTMFFIERFFCFHHHEVEDGEVACRHEHEAHEHHSHGHDGGGTALGYALGFAAGTFFCIAGSDLLPELQFHDHDRGKLSMALLLGLALAYGVCRLEGLSHTHPSALPGEMPPAAAVDSSSARAGALVGDSLRGEPLAWRRTVHWSPVVADGLLPTSRESASRANVNRGRRDARRGTQDVRRVGS